MIDRNARTDEIPTLPKSPGGIGARMKALAVLRRASAKHATGPKPAKSHQPTKDYSRDLAELLDALAIAKTSDDAVETDAAIQLASTKANHLGIDLAVARQNSGSIEWPNSLVEEQIQLGRIGDRDFPSYVELFVTYAAQHGIRTIQDPKHSTLYCYGYAEDIATTVDLYDVTIEQILNRIEADITAGNHHHLDVPPQTYRRSVLAGFNERLRERLREELREYIAESHERQIAHAERETVIVRFMRERTKTFDLVDKPRKTSNINAAAFMSGAHVADALTFGEEQDLA